MGLKMTVINQWIRVHASSLMDATHSDLFFLLRDGIILFQINFLSSVVYYLLFAYHSELTTLFGFTHQIVLSTGFTHHCTVCPLWSHTPQYTCSIHHCVMDSHFGFPHITVPFGFICRSVLDTP